MLGRSFDLLVPEAVSGRVVEVRVRDRVASVEYGEPLFALLADAAGATAASPISARGTEVSSISPAAGGARAEAESGPTEDARLGPGQHAIRATTAGIFYSRPDPELPPFVSAGSTLAAGETAGLIEVMKCFSPIVHPGGALPSPLIVAEVRVRDGEEVHPGQILFVLGAP